MNPKTTIGLDVGRSAVKVVAHGTNGLFYRDNFPNLVWPWFHIADEAAAERAALDTVEVAGRKFFIGETARLQGNATMSAGLSDDWIEGEDYLALVSAAVKRLAARGAPDLNDAFVVLGTPAHLYGQHREILVEQTKKVIDGEFKVIPQPMGAYSSFFMDERGMPKRDVMFDGKRSRSWAVVDVGHYTTDFLLLREGQYVEQAAESCDGIHSAAADLVRILRNQKINITPVAAEKALLDREVMHFGTRRIDTEVDQALETVVKNIISKANQLLSKHVAHLDGVLVAGGGADLIFKALHAKWPHARLVENPRMAVAEGYCRYGIGIQAKRQAFAKKAAEAAA